VSVPRPESSSIPDAPGAYLFRDGDGRVVYVGKARSLRKRLYGLTIRPERLQQIRNERRPGSRYATLSNCEFEVREAEALMQQEGVPVLDVTSKSVEELATTILQEAKLLRRIY